MLGAGPGPACVVHLPLRCRLRASVAISRLDPQLHTMSPLPCSTLAWPGLWALQGICSLVSGVKCGRRPGSRGWMRLLLRRMVWLTRCRTVA